MSFMSFTIGGEPAMIRLLPCVGWSCRRKSVSTPSSMSQMAASAVMYVPSPHTNSTQSRMSPTLSSLPPSPWCMFSSFVEVGFR